MPEQQITGVLVNQITAVPAMDGRMIYLRLKGAKSDTDHNFFLPPTLGEKLYP